MTWNDAYLESRVLSANPMELIRMLYQKALRCVADAREHLAAGDIAARSLSISHAIAIISELDSSLDHASGGEISRNLGELYQYIRQRLIEANLRQQDAPLQEAAGLLETLAQAWCEVRPEADPVPAGIPNPGVAAGVWQSSDLAGSHTWSA